MPVEFRPMSGATFVLVHGAWGGAWIWRRVIGPLRAAGHEVHAVTLTGDGERAHLRRPDITLRTHIDDVLGLIDAEELRDIVLVGHSYAGQVITGVADALLARGTGTLRQLVYVDAMVPLPGEGWGSNHPPEVVAARRAAAAANDNALPPPDPRDFGLEGADRDWLLQAAGAPPLRTLSRAAAVRRRALGRRAALLHRLHPARLSHDRWFAPAGSQPAGLAHRRAADRALPDGQRARVADPAPARTGLTPTPCRSGLGRLGVCTGVV